MTFDDVLAQVLELLQRQGRVAYGALKRRFALDDAYLDDLKAELIDARRLAVDEGGRILVWQGAADVPPQDGRAERRQLTVLFCDLADSTALARQLDPEDLRVVVQAYQQACAEVVRQFDGHIAQYLVDGLLVYFGYPRAHEDDAQRAVRAGLGMVAALGPLNVRLAHAHGLRLALRLGIHTGLVVVGAVGGGAGQEQLALGDTPNIAARLQSLAAPDTVLLSATTFRLVEGYFTCHALEAQPLKGVSTPFQAYQVVGATGMQSRFEVATRRGLAPLVGREQEMGVLRARWAQAVDGLGQMVVLSGEAGIGKSRLVQELREHVAGASVTPVTLHCSPYHLYSPLHPVIAHLHRVLQEADDGAPTSLATLERLLAAAGLPLSEAVPLFAALLSWPPPASYPPLTLSPQRQKQQTLDALVAWLLAETERRPVLMVWEDLHWADPSTLELLALTLDQTPMARLLLLVTCRPEFAPPWPARTYLASLHLSRLSQAQAAVLAERVAGGRPLPPAVRQQIVAQTDGVPLFVEEVTRAVRGSGLLQEDAAHSTRRDALPPLAIPATLHDALMARLDHLSAVKAVAQLGATIGRDFAYGLLQAVASWDEPTLQQSLRQLVEAELLYQRGLPPQATYRFKHALIQEAAYQSLLKSTRQQYHQRIAQALEAQFPETVATQPEVLAHHYTEALLNEQAILYWQRAGERALERSAHAEAVGHLRQGLEVLTTLADTPERTQHELTLHLTLGPALTIMKGFSSPDVEQTYTRARGLCQHLGESPQLFSTLFGLWEFYLIACTAALQPARELAAQMLGMAQRQENMALLLQAQVACGMTWFHSGETAMAWTHLEAGRMLYDPQQHHPHTFLYGGHDPGVTCLSYGAPTLWLLGYPDRALAWSNEALSLAEALAHPFSIGAARFFASVTHQLRHESSLLHAQSEALLALAGQYDFPHFVSQGKVLSGWAVARQGQYKEGLTRIREGFAIQQAIGSAIGQTHWLALLADVHVTSGQSAEGLAQVAEGLALTERSGEQFYMAELYRLQGELLQQTEGDRSQDNEERPSPEACFQRALAIARQQRAKSWELRAAMSLSRLWQRQGKRAEARQLLAPVYGWFTEGFATADLQEARALLEALG